MQGLYNDFLINLNASGQTPLWSFIINMIFTAILSYHMRSVYLKYGKSLSKRDEFGRNFLMISVITMLIISIVNSSLALSLGLVGALSIIRFRSAIKEPEELIYLFFAISLGLGFGANQGIITIAAYILILLFIVIDNKVSNKEKSVNNLFLTITNENSEKNQDLDKIIKILNQNCSAINFRRYDNDSENYEISFNVEFDSIDDFMKIEEDLREYNNDITIRFFDNSGIY